MRRTLLLTAFLLGSLPLTPVGAQLTDELPAEAEPEEPEYLIELIAFRYRDGAQSSEELWRAPPPALVEPETEDELVPGDPEGAIDEEGEEALAEEELLPEEGLLDEELMELPTRADLIPMPRTEFQLLDIARKLASSSRYEPIAHIGWKQQGYPLEIAPAYTLDDELWEANLGGSITFSKGRYLRLDVDVKYGPYGMTRPTVNRPLFDPYGTSTVSHSPVFEITENRRGMKNNEIHFFDHPEFALLARITLLEKPEAESEADETDTEQTAGN